MITRITIQKDIWAVRKERYGPSGRETLAARSHSKRRPYPPIVEALQNSSARELAIIDCAFSFPVRLD